MAADIDNDILVASSASSTARPVATDVLDTLNGVTQTGTKPRAQRIKILYGLDGDGTDVSDVNGMPMRDTTPPFQVLSQLGGSASPTASELVAANTQRTRVDIMHAGTTSRVWLGVGGPPTPGHGYFLDPGDVFSEYLTLSVQVQLDPAASTSAEAMSYVELR